MRPQRELNLPGTRKLSALTAAISEHGGVVGAVCHCPAALLNVKRSSGEYLIKDLFVAAFTNDEEHEVGLDRVVPFMLADNREERGAHHNPARNPNTNVVMSDRLVTGQTRRRRRESAMRC